MVKAAAQLGCGSCSSIEEDLEYSTDFGVRPLYPLLGH